MKEFKAESKRLLDLMINSIYTHKEIFLRELISNASDALDKMRYLALTDNNITYEKDDYFIRISIDKESREITVSENGIGMSVDELENNLGIIAKSGSLDFKTQTAPGEDIDIIGKFGVGFYSAFMVADEIRVVSRAFGSEEANLWESGGIEGFNITSAKREQQGTDITLKLKKGTDEENYDDYLDEYEIRSLVKKYSDFIRYPIKMLTKTTKTVDGKEEETIEDQVLNSMVPIWKKQKSTLTKEDYDGFYNEKHYGYDTPLRSIHANVEGSSVNYSALMYIPSSAPYDFYTKDYRKGLELYSSGVLIMDKCPDLLPDYFAFVKGLVDSGDLTLNISREMLQHDRQLKFIAKKVKEKIKSELLDMQKAERGNYEKFFKAFGRQLKYGVYSEYAVNRDVLEDLLLFYSSFEKKYVTLAEYTDRMKEDQKFIYYACGDSMERIAKMPQAEAVTENGYEILYLTDDVDEFTVRMLMNYKEKQFKSVSDKDLGLKDEPSVAEEGDKKLFEKMKELLGDKVKEVRASKRLKTHPVCLVADGGLSIEMEKVLKSMPDAQGFKPEAEKALEINEGNEIFGVLKTAFDSDADKFALLTNILYNQALLIEGLPIDDPVQYCNDICKMMK